ncbi:MAG TPA: ABC transporter ATP-binding protein [Ramlibacter sp.]|uniref:ABC transporter ATP-binding protein n=1 Tax=Ramlibacter sp. TaxID=1917967 RepID=UPI002C6AE642|nr:ABC transporter ATP-binding protein [Ramlibacter sp.]HVZ46607.1 ABC transporter ATP-binding protein [Ramlibacter sp.]
MKSVPAAPILQVDDLHVRFPAASGMAHAVRGVTFDVRAGETVAIVGESGSGKSVTAMSILRLLGPNARMSGDIFFEGRDLGLLAEREMRQLRGNEIGMIFQDPMASLNPLFPVGKQIAECLLLHSGMSGSEARERTSKLLVEVGIPDPQRRARQYPHELSGGMCQRIMIAMAIASRPKLLIADEPTTALDVTIQAQILDVLQSLAHEQGSAVLLVTHDLGVVREFATRVLVMYAGRIVESAATETLFHAPLHPYTRGLMGAMPPPVVAGSGYRRLNEIRGCVPSAKEHIDGCSFRPRCDRATDVCRGVTPQPHAFASLHSAACHNPLSMKEPA